MSWSYDSWRAARRPWELVIHGRSWTARPVSAEAVLAYQAEIIGASRERAWQATLALLRKAFPWRPSYIWRGDPVKHFAQVIREAPDAAAQALQDFFPLLRGAESPSGSPTNGTASQR